MVKAIASLALVALMILSTLGNFWFTYGVWPRSWWSFVFFAVAGITLHALLVAVGKAEE